MRQGRVAESAIEREGERRLEPPAGNCCARWHWQHFEPESQSNLSSLCLKFITFILCCFPILLLILLPRLFRFLTVFLCHFIVRVCGSLTIPRQHFKSQKQSEGTKSEALSVESCLFTYSTPTPTPQEPTPPAPLSCQA